MHRSNDSQSGAAPVSAAGAVTAPLCAADSPDRMTAMGAGIAQTGVARASPRYVCRRKVGAGRRTGMRRS